MGTMMTFYKAIMFDGIVKSWFMPQTATYEQRMGGDPDTFFQDLLLNSG